MKGNTLLNTVSITIVARNNSPASAAKDVVHNEAIASWAILFESERWFCIERVAIALLPDNSPVGIATLSPHGELGDIDEAPQIVGVWVHPDQRGQSIGTALLAALADESQRLYNKAPKLFAATRAGNALAKRALTSGVNIDVVDVGASSDLP